MRIAVIMSTYEQPWHLERALEGYLLQTRPPDELLIADDGSGEPTRAVIAAFAARAKFPVLHLRHEHQGWRKQAIVNRAMVTATSEYVILTDGDCIPRSDFVAAHARLARPRTFLSGGDYRLPQNVTTALSFADIRSGAAFRVSRLRELGLPPGAKTLKLRVGPKVGGLLDLANTSRVRLGGSNASTWREALLAVNGLDESFLSPCKDDVEMGERLRNSGLRGRHIRHQAICLHLNHERGYWNPEFMRDNLVRLDETRRAGRTVAARGIAQASVPCTVTRYAAGQVVELPAAAGTNRLA